MSSRKDNSLKRVTFDKDILYNSKGKINTKTRDNMNISAGIFEGVGFPLSNESQEVKRVFIKWKTLNSHKLTIGTTRQGKSRKMISDIDQQIAHGDNVFIGEPKGSVGQEIIGYTIESLIKHNRLKEYIYISAYFNEYSTKFNPLFGKKNTELVSLVAEIIEATEAVYINVGKVYTLAISMALDFIERYDEMFNPYDKIIMEKMEYAKLETQTVNSLNKYIWEEDYQDSIHGTNWDIIRDLKDGKNEIEKLKIDEAYERTLARYDYTKNIKNGVIPLRRFITFKDIAEFEVRSNFERLADEFKKRKEELFKMPKNEELKRFAAETDIELDKRLADSEDFIKKLGTCFSTSLTELITEDIGKIFNDCKVNPLMDALTSNERGAVIVYQPFPLIYSTASVAMGRILFSMFSSMAGYIGASGSELKRRLFINVDEAGEILSPIIKKLSNKGGGLGFSLCLYTQSIADIEETLGLTGARILLDNMNTKEFFKVNDNSTAREVAIAMGTISKASASVMGSDKRDTRATVSINDKDVASESIIQRLNERTYLLKEGNEVYLMAAPYVPDAQFKIFTPLASYGELSKTVDTKRQAIRKLLN